MLAAADVNLLVEVTDAAGALNRIAELSSDLSIRAHVADRGALLADIHEISTGSLARLEAASGRRPAPPVKQTKRSSRRS